MSQEPLQEPIELPLETQLALEQFYRQVEQMYSIADLQYVAKSLIHSSAIRVQVLGLQANAVMRQQRALITDQVHVITSLREQIDRLKAREERRRKGDRLALAVSAVFVIAIVLVAWLRPALGKDCRGDARRDYPGCTTEVRDARDAG